MDRLIFGSLIVLCSPVFVVVFVMVPVIAEVTPLPLSGDQPGFNQLMLEFSAPYVNCYVIHSVLIRSTSENQVHRFPPWVALAPSD